MLKITQHIERLLLHNDCVIIPDFGGFVVQECCARYVEEEGIFLPPYRGVIFNPRLRSNDGLLVDAVARERAIDFHEATMAVQTETDELRAAISAQGSLTIPGIGTLRATDGSSYEFEPIACGLAAPALHGLDSFYVPLYHAKSEHLHKQEETPLAGQDVLTIRLRRSHIRRVAVAAIACICVAIALTSGRISSLHNEVGEAGMMQQWWSTMVERLQLTPHAVSPTIETPPAPPQPKKAAPTPKPKAPVEVKNEPSAPDEPSVSVPDETPALNYTIVVASAIPLKNAQAMVDDWNSRGMPKTQTLETGKMVRVICGSYATEEEAREALLQYRVTHDGFAEAWIYHVP